MDYYNEFDPFAASWLRNLIAAGELPEGTVDERSIKDVDYCGAKTAHFFAGIGGWPFALKLAGWPIDRPVWTGSCPCQPFSAAGKRQGEADDRHLWPEFFRLIRQHRPATIFGEQVASPDGLRWLDGVFADLEGEGYACGAADLCAASLNSPHIRQRLFWVAHAGYETGSSKQGQQLHRPGRTWQSSGGTDRLANSEHSEPWMRSEGGQETGERRSGLTDGSDIDRLAVGDGHVVRGVASAGQQSEHEQDGGDGGVEHPTRDGRQQWRTESEWRSVASGCGDERLGESFQSRLEGLTGHVGHGHESGRDGADAGRSVASAGQQVADGLFQPVSNGRSGERIAERWTGETAWASSRIIACLDGKSRRVGCGIQPLAARVPVKLGPLKPRLEGLGVNARLARSNRVGRLKGYGNAIVPQLAAMLIMAFMEGEYGSSVSEV